MNVLFLTYVYPPQKSPRSVQIAHLVNFLRMQMSIKVITSEVENFSDSTLNSFTSLDNVMYAKKAMLTRFIEQYAGDRLQRMFLPDMFYPWHHDLLKKTSEYLSSNHIDLIITFGQPMSVHIVGIKLKNKFPHLKWIAHFSDPWIDNIYNQYNVWTKRINQYFQDKIFLTADKLVFTSDETIDLVVKRYQSIVRAKSACVPHCFVDSLYPTTSFKEDNFIIRYMGNFYGNRQPFCLFEALKILNNNKVCDFKIELIGHTTIDIQKTIDDYGLENIVSIFQPVSYVESLKLMKNADLLLLIDAVCETSPFLPSKLVDYIGANKPIFGITPPGTSQKIIEKMGFMVAHPNNPNEIADKLLAMLSILMSGKKIELSQQIRDLYSVTTVGNQFANIINNLCSL